MILFKSFVNKNSTSKLIEQIFLKKIRFNTTATSSLIVNVKNKINEKRQQSLLGGGQKRIDTQHAKVYLDFY